jgi:hypothetical protein
MESFFSHVTWKGFSCYGMIEHVALVHEGKSHSNVTFVTSAVLKRMKKTHFASVHEGKKYVFGF